MDITAGVWYALAAVVLAIIIYNAVKIVQEYERGVIFRLGRLVGAKGPGLFLIIPVLDRIVKIDLRVVTVEIPTQEVITKDNVSVRVNAVLYFRVYDPAKAVVNVTDFVRATLQIAQTTLRSVLGQSELDELLAQRDKVNETLQRIIDSQTEPWGIKVTTVEVKDLELPQTMQRAMARQAEAEREKRAKIIHAEGELQASQSLAQAAKMLASEEQSLQLRYLQTLSEIATEKNSTIVFPLPIDLISAFLERPSRKKRRRSTPTSNESPPPSVARLPEPEPLLTDQTITLVRPTLEAELPEVEEVEAEEAELPDDITEVEDPAVVVATEPQSKARNGNRASRNRNNGQS